MSSERDVPERALVGIPDPDIADARFLRRGEIRCIVVVEWKELERRDQEELDQAIAR